MSEVLGSVEYVVESLEEYEVVNLVECDVLSLRAYEVRLDTPALQASVELLGNVLQE